ncbi:MAG TPA: AIM24 family protein, partial [Vicinamibacteria bacterium]|nr:AIM24 family protein [Vicinamibacteria bacterium]
GKVILTDKDREVTFMQVQDETVYVEPSHLLACEESLTPRYVPLGDLPGVEVLALDGRGMVALSVASKPLALSVTPDLPVSVPAASVITWSGGLNPHIVDDQQIYAVMAPSGARPGPVIRLEGTGRVLVEQGSA